MDLELATWFDENTKLITLTVAVHLESGDVIEHPINEFWILSQSQEYRAYGFLYHYYTLVLSDNPDITIRIGPDPHFVSQYLISYYRRRIRKFVRSIAAQYNKTWIPCVGEWQLSEGRHTLYGRIIKSNFSRGG